MILQDLTTSFKSQLLEGVHDFRLAGGDSFKIALYSDQANLNSSTTAYTATGEISATGYTAGGLLLTNISPSSSGTVGFTSFQDAVWSNSGILARGALIYNTTPNGAYTNPSVMVIDFGMNRSSVSNTFTVSFPTFNNQYAIIRIADSNG